MPRIPGLDIWSDIPTDPTLIDRVNLTDPGLRAKSAQRMLDRSIPRLEEAVFKEQSCRVGCRRDGAAFVQLLLTLVLSIRAQS